MRRRVLLSVDEFSPTLPAVVPPSYPSSSGSQFEPFNTTHWSVVLVAGDSSDHASAHSALTQLCQTYWVPLYGMVRRRGHSMHDAEDLTQGFFAHLIQSRAYARVDQQKGKFRAFLLAALRNFLADARDHAQARKRGGDYRFLPLDEVRVSVAETMFQTCHDTAFAAAAVAGSTATSEDQQFERQWAQTLVNTALERLAEEYREDGRAALFDELAVFVKGSSQALPSYEALAGRLGISAVTLRSHVTRLRERYRELLRAEVRRTVDRPDAVDEELRELLRVLTKR